MSIHPEFAARILTGEKQVEFRRRPAAKSITHIVIYATSPVSAVIGVAEIERRQKGSPRKLWKEFRDVGGIDRANFFRYFSGIRQGVAYVVRRTWSCDEPVPLGREGLPPTAPQAFRYVNGQALDAVLDQSRAVGRSTEVAAERQDTHARRRVRPAVPG